jgi:hypothetical protein
MNIGIIGNGVVLSCDNETCTILTVAHLCNPLELIDSTIVAYKNGLITVEERKRRITELSSITQNEQLCAGSIIPGNGMEYTTISPLFVDFDRDLMIVKAYLPNKKTNIRLSYVKSIVPGTEIYTAAIGPQTNIRVTLFSRTGPANTVILTDTHEEKDNYLQANFPVGPGASGAPAFMLRTHMLIGVIAAQLADGIVRAPIRATYIIKTNDIREFLLEYTRNKNDSKSNGLYCNGKDYLCAMVHGEMPLLDAYGHSTNEKIGNATNTKSQEN